MNILKIVFILVFNIVAVRPLLADSCPQSSDSNLSDILKIAQTNYLNHAQVIDVDIRPYSQIEEDKKFYDYGDLALDAGLAGIVYASKDHLEDDKYKHLVAGAIISYGATQLAKIYFKNDKHAQLKSVLTGVALATLVGIIKEVRDNQGFGTPDYKDALYTTAGGALVAIRFNIKF